MRYFSSIFIAAIPSKSCFYLCKWPHLEYACSISFSFDIASLVVHDSSTNVYFIKSFSGYDILYFYFSFSSLGSKLYLLRKPSINVLIAWIKKKTYNLLMLVIFSFTLSLRDTKNYCCWFVFVKYFQHLFF